MNVVSLYAVEQEVSHATVKSHLSGNMYASYFIIMYIVHVRVLEAKRHTHAKNIEMTNAIYSML